MFCFHRRKKLGRIPPFQAEVELDDVVDTEAEFFAIEAPNRLRFIVVRLLELLEIMPQTKRELFGSYKRLKIISLIYQTFYIYP